MVVTQNLSSWLKLPLLLPIQNFIMIAIDDINPIPHGEGRFRPPSDCLNHNFR